MRAMILLPFYRSDFGYDKDVATFLYGLDMSKYLELFNTQSIDLDVFLSLTDEDLQYIGVIDPDDRKTLVKGISNFKTYKTINFEETEDVVLSDREVLVITTNTLKQLTVLNAALAHTRLRLKATPVRNIIYEKHTAASLLSTLADEALSQVSILRARITGLESLENVNQNPSRYTMKRRLGWTLFTASALSTVLAVFTLHFMRRPR